MRQIAPTIIILELSSNDLVKVVPEIVGSELEKLVQDLHDVYSVKFVVVGQVLRGRTRDSEEYNCEVGKLHQYLKVLLEQLPFCYYWQHRGFWNCKQDLYLPDGVHLINLGYYKFMHSIRVAVLNAVKLVGVSAD